MTSRSITFTRSKESSSTLPPARSDFLNRVPVDEKPSDNDNSGVLRIETASVFKPLFQHRRFKGARGGRGGAKSHFFCDKIIEDCLTRHTRQACLREVQNSIAESVKQLLEDKINFFGYQDQFKITEREITGPYDSLIIFKGLRNHTVSSLKSLEGFTDAFVEEAHVISQRSLDTMIPTFRNNSQMSFAWNPALPTDPVDSMFMQALADGDDDFCLVEASWETNPWLPDELYRDLQRDRRRDPEKYQHIWGGGYIQHSEARVFKNWVVEGFDTPGNASFLHGADWGYSVDPTVLVRCFIGRWENGKAIADPAGKVLFVDREVYKIGCELDHTPKLFDGIVPGMTGAARDWPIIADSSNPQAISYLRRHGYPNIKKSVKGSGSIKEGVAFLQSYDIVVHPRCTHTQDELTHYSYKLDPLTNLVLPILSDKKNHVIDSLRYAIEPVRRPTGHSLFGTQS